MKDENLQFVLNNVRVKYAKVIRPGKAYDDNKPDEWSVNMYVTDEDAKRLEKAGCSARADKDGGEYFLAKRAVKSGNGKDVDPPRIVDAAKKPWNGDDIGNGSVCNVIVTLFPWNRKGRTGVFIYLNAMQVVNFVPYKKSDVDSFDAVEGAEASNDKTDDLPF